MQVNVYGPGQVRRARRVQEKGAGFDPASLRLLFEYLREARIDANRALSLEARPKLYIYIYISYRELLYIYII